MLLNVCAHESAYKYHQCNHVIDLFTNTGVAFPCRLCTHHKLTRARSCSVSKRTTVTVKLAVNADSETEYKCRLQLTETTVSVEMHPTQSWEGPQRLLWPSSFCQVSKDPFIQSGDCLKLNQKKHPWWWIVKDHGNYVVMAIFSTSLHRGLCRGKMAWNRLDAAKYVVKMCGHSLACSSVWGGCRHLGSILSRATKCSAHVTL